MTTIICSSHFSPFFPAARLTQSSCALLFLFCVFHVACNVKCMLVANVSESHISITPSNRQHSTFSLAFPPLSLSVDYHHSLSSFVVIALSLPAPPWYMKNFLLFNFGWSYFMLIRRSNFRLTLFLWFLSSSASLVGFCVCWLFFCCLWLVSLSEEGKRATLEGLSRARETTTQLFHILGWCVDVHGFPWNKEERRREKTEPNFESLIKSN